MLVSYKIHALICDDCETEFGFSKQRTGHSKADTKREASRLGWTVPVGSSILAYCPTCAGKRTPKVVLFSEQPQEVQDRWLEVWTNNELANRHGDEHRLFTPEQLSFEGVRAEILAERLAKDAVEIKRRGTAAKPGGVG